MNGLSPITSLTPGTAVTVQLGHPPAVSAIIVSNQSIYTLTLNLGGSSATLPAWTANRYDVGNMASFSGILIITPGGNVNGAVNPSSQILIDVYGPGEPVPGGYPIPLAVNGGQQRVIAVPITTETSFIGFHTWGALETFVLADTAIAYAGTIANQSVSVYLYRCNFTVITAGTGQNLMSLQVQEVTQGGAVVGTHTIHQFGWVTGATAPYTPQLAHCPARLLINCGATTNYLRPCVNNANGTSIQLTYDVAMETDSVNVATTTLYPGGIGGGKYGSYVGPSGSFGTY